MFGDLSIDKYKIFALFQINYITMSHAHNYDSYYENYNSLPFKTHEMTEFNEKSEQIIKILNEYKKHHLFEYIKKFLATKLTEHLLSFNFIFILPKKIQKLYIESLWFLTDYSDLETYILNELPKNKHDKKIVNDGYDKSEFEKYIKKNKNENVHTIMTKLFSYDFIFKMASNEILDYIKTFQISTLL